MNIYCYKFYEKVENNNPEVKLTFIKKNSVT